MAEAIESMSTPELRAEVGRGRAAKAYQRAKEKAASMQLVEKGVAISLATGVGALHAWKPELEAGLGGVGYINPVLTLAGLGGLFMLKGMAKEAASGTFLAGAVPLCSKLGAKIVESIG